MAVVAAITRVTSAVSTDNSGTGHTLPARKTVEATVTFTGASSYATGGIPTVAADYGLTTMDNLEVIGAIAGTALLNRVGGAYNIVLTTAMPGITEIGAAGDPTGKTVYVRAHGV